MELSVGDVSDDNLDDDVTSVEVARESEKERLKREALMIEGKLRRYESECHRYSLHRVKMIQLCIEHDEVTESLNLDDYAIGSLQCQIMFETLAMNPLTLLTKILINEKQSTRSVLLPLDLKIHQS